MGLALNHIDHQRIGELARNARIFNPGKLHQFTAQSIDIDQRHGPVALAQHALIDLEFVDMLDPANFNPLDLEPGIGCEDCKLLPGHRGHSGKTRNYPCQRHCSAQNRGEEHPVELFLAERHPGHDAVKGRAGPRPCGPHCPGLALRSCNLANAFAAAFDLLAHGAASLWARASAMIASTRSP